MELTTLKATSRVLGAGSREMQRLRKTGMIPAVYYGKGIEPVSVAVSADDVRKVLVPGKRYALLDLEIDGKAGNPVVIYDYQKDAISQKITHIDFLKIEENSPVKVVVPVTLSGIPVGVKAEGGMLSQITRKLKLSVLPTKIPSVLTIDVSACHAGTTFYAENMDLGDAVLVSKPRTVIFTISKARGPKEDS
ncbi:MAG: 50S ribosomal protein L25 [Fibrobacteraceae bacterium]|jgi:large subunit ribosomal protein L25|nr:50S ribosomal protein L25 [Fibrobacteraceae bacterium]MBQ5611074.1 50S ribosomal protein L25 [Fibrobacteraceae bacterium]MEE1275755.1 50S ribosomal protein L25 [Fibrobacteraceae bacterium]